MSQKVSTLQTLTQSAGEDLLLIVDDPSGTPTSKKISVGGLMGALTVPVSTTSGVSGNTVVATSSVAITTPVAVPTSSTTLPVGTITWDSNYLYVTVSAGVTKRVALNSF